MYGDFNLRNPRKAANNFCTTTFYYTQQLELFYNASIMCISKTRNSEKYFFSQVCKLQNIY